MKRFMFTLLGGAVFSALSMGLVIDPAYAISGKTKKVIKRNDADDDGRISKGEWPKSEDIFIQIDENQDGFLSEDELDAFFTGKTAKKPQTQKLSGDLVDVSQIDEKTKIAFKGRADEPFSVERGLLESTLIPVYPKDHYCPKIDHVYGEYWRGPTPNRLHTGADIPASWDEPIHAMADGEVVAKFLGNKGSRGLQVVIRHTPEDTGYPVWIYTLYSHFNKMPDVKIGQRVKMGDYLGPNGKTGVPGKKRGPHLHLTVNYSYSPLYALTPNYLFPMEGYFIDPVALFRGEMPIDTNKVKALPETKKKVEIAYKLKSGEIIPKGSKVIWPFACRPN